MNSTQNDIVDGGASGIWGNGSLDGMSESNGGEEISGFNDLYDMSAVSSMSEVTGVSSTNDVACCSSARATSSETRKIRRSRMNRTSNRITVCPECLGKLSNDKSAVTSNNGFIYRVRPCAECGGVIHTKQPPEVICVEEKGPGR